MIAVGFPAGIAMNVFGIDPIKALLWSAVHNGITAVPLLIAITLLANDRRVMGRWTNARAANVVAWTTVVFMGLAAAALFIPWANA